MAETHGFMKALVEVQSDRILGFTMLGREAGEVIACVQTAMLAGLPYTGLRDAILTHPTMAEKVSVRCLRMSRRTRRQGLPGMSLAAQGPVLGKRPGRSGGEERSCSSCQGFRELVMTCFWHPVINQLRSPVLVFDGDGLALLAVSGARVWA